MTHREHHFVVIGSLIDGKPVFTIDPDISGWLGTSGVWQPEDDGFGKWIEYTQEVLDDDNTIFAELERRLR